jgi:hypothetical protein
VRGGWIWRNVILFLWAADHDVQATTGAGLGDRVHLVTPVVDLDTHVSDLVNVLAFDRLSDVVLVS